MYIGTIYSWNKDRIALPKLIVPSIITLAILTIV